MIEVSRTRRPPLPAERPPGRYAPYAPAAAVARVLAYDRERGLREPVDTASLERAGVARSMCPRTLRALRFLGLVDEAGFRTESFERLRAASSGDVPSALRRVLQNAYRDILAKTDLRRATDGDLDEAFRGFEPPAQRPRMVAMFRGLAAQAGLLPQEAPPARRATTRRGTTAVASAAGYGLLQSLFETLPANHSWTAGERSRWIQAWVATLDLVIDQDSSDGERGTQPAS